VFKYYLADKSGNDVSVNLDAGEDRGLVVATRDHKSYTTRTVFFTNPTYGREMAQNGLYGGELLLHDGTDTAAWTASEVVGTAWDAVSTNRPYDTAKSIESSNNNINDILQVLNNVGPGNNIDMTAAYVALTMWINVDKDWKAGDSVSVYAHVDGNPVGNKVYLEDYFDFDNYDIWQWIDIPLTDMGISTSMIDAFRIEIESREGPKSPVFYIDEWYLKTTGAPIDFEVIPDKGTWFHVKAFQTTFVDGYDPDNADGTMPNLAYDQILGVTPTTGYIYKRYSAGEPDPIFEVRITNLLDLLSLPYSKINNYISDGTNTLITIENTYPTGMEFILKAEDLDKLVFTIDDALDDLLYFRVCVQGYVEQR
jgi:hypothetical protein